MYLTHQILLFVLITSVVSCAQINDQDQRLQVAEIPPAQEDPYTSNNAGNTMVGVTTAESMAGEMTGNIMAGEMTGNITASEMTGNIMAGEMTGNITAVEMIPQDSDQDFINDSEDNCPYTYNPEQADIDRDGQGDACEPDADQDGIPDQWDPAPMDMNWPGRALPSTVYANTSSDLYALDVKRLSLSYVTTFRFDRIGEHLLTDIAFNRSGILWATSYDRLWVCHPQRGECRDQGSLPTQFNGLTFIPGDLFSADQDILVGISLDGTWYQLDVSNGLVSGFIMGSYPNESSSGDAFSIEDLGTFAAVKRPNVDDDIIISLNPTRVNQINDIATLTGYQNIFGLAGWRGLLFAFDETGAILQINLQTREVLTVANDGHSWWGAGVSSVLHTRPSP